MVFIMYNHNYGYHILLYNVTNINGVTFINNDCAHAVYMMVISHTAGLKNKFF